MEDDELKLPAPRAELVWAAVDFDGTLTCSLWSPDNPVPTPGPPNPRNVEQARELAAHGYKIVVHTARPWADHETIQAWLTHYGVPYHQIVCGKLLAAVYIDDRAINADEDNWLAWTKDIAG